MDPISRPMCAAGALFVDPDGLVLLVEPTYKDGWEIPGGLVEPGETPAQACRREVAEELGLELDPGRLLVVDWAPDGVEDKVLFVFDGGVLDDERLDHVHVDHTEIRAWHFVHPARLADHLIPRLARRVTAALRARADDVTRYLEHGVPRPVDAPGPGDRPAGTA